MAAEKLYYRDAYQTEFTAVVTGVRPAAKGFEVCLDRTAFYPEGGGQPADTGILTAESGEEIRVLDVHEKDGDVRHLCEAPLREGETVRGRIDWARRFDHMQQHSGEHIVSGLICARYRCSNVGFHLGREVVEIDFDAEIPPEGVREIEEAANRYLWEEHALEVLLPSPEELAEMEYRSKKELSGEVRITRWPGADTCACCGTHVRRTGEIGMVLLTGSLRMKGGTRIELLCGARALTYLRQLRRQNEEISHLLSAKWDRTAEAAARLKEENGKLKAEKAEAERRREEEILSCVTQGDVLLFEDFSPDRARELATQAAAVCGGICALFCGTDESGRRYVIAKKDGDLRPFIREMNEVLSGRGGGKANFQQGTVTAPRARIEAFFAERFTALPNP